MKKESLKKKLEAANIPEYVYNLSGQGRKDERLCLEQVGSKWNVYYLERGKKTTNEFFDTEEEACQFLDQLILE